MTFNELMQKYVNMDYEELVSIAKSAVTDFLPGLKANFDEEETAYKFLVILVGACIGVDGNVTALEAKFVSEVLGTDFSAAQLNSIAANSADDNGLALVDNVIDACDSDMKAALCVFCTAAMSIDETISRPEVAYIQKLMA